MSGIDNDELEEVVDRISEAGIPLTVYFDHEGKIRTQRIDAKSDNMRYKGCQIVGVYDYGVDFMALKADVEYVRSNGYN